MTIRSFRVAFEFERRIFSVDRWRLPVAYGVPLRSVAYALAALAAVVVASRLPMAGAALTALPAPVRFVVAPLAAAYGLTRVDVDGRAAHVAAVALLRHLGGPRRLVALRRAPARRQLTIGELTLVPDARAARYRHAVVRGPARLVMRYPARVTSRGRNLWVEQTSSVPLRRPREVALSSGQRVRFE